MPTENIGLVPEVNLTNARNLSPLFDEAVRRDRPIMIVRNRRERGLLLSRDGLLRLLLAYPFHVNVLPEEDGSFTLWLRELDVGGHGATLRDARRELLAAVRSYVQDYLEQFDFYRHLTNMAPREPYVRRLSLARDDAELIAMLFPAEPA